jgi:cell division protein FtsW (lipid II flippase)
MSENGALAAFLLVIMVALVGVRSGRALAATLTRNGGSTHSHVARLLLPGAPPDEERRPLPAAATLPPPYTGGAKVPAWMMVLYLVAPLLLLLPLAVIDMGLLLVMVIPIGVASVLALGVHRLTRGWQAASALFAFALVFVLFTKVLFPDVQGLSSDDPSARAERFEEMQRVLGVRLPVVGASLERAAARAVAARDQRAAEELLVSARPGLARDLLQPSIEQAWASRAYSAAGALGVGLGAAPIGRGVAEAVSYAENSYAVYVLHEHGVLGGTAVMLAYLTFALAVMLLVRATPHPTESLRASRAMFLVAALIVTVPAVYVALSNVGVVPITGQNMPFLGLNAWSDVTLCAGVVGILVTGALRTEAHTGRRWARDIGPSVSASRSAGSSDAAGAAADEAAAQLQPSGAAS